MKKFKKSPLTDKPLRNPGQSLDEEINKIYRDDINDYAMWAGVVIMLAGMEWWRWYAHTPYAPITYSVLAIIVTVFSGYKIYKLKLRVSNLKLGRDGERAVGQYLELLREKGCRIFHDIVGDNFNLDHVIISEHGVFVIETKTYSKPKTGGAKIIINTEQLSINGYHPDKDIIIQAKAEANWLKGVLRETSGKDVFIKPVIVFPGWYIDSSHASKNLDVWVLNPKALPTYITNTPKILSTEDMMLLSYHISRYIRSS
ncbi:MAG: nuclease-related domain-containing protein [Pseudomonadota bacterium]